MVARAKADAITNQPPLPDPMRFRAVPPGAISQETRWKVLLHGARYLRTLFCLP
jgi:hypothetical protein